jgi:hypothetical protein
MDRWVAFGRSVESTRAAHAASLAAVQHRLDGVQL